MVRVEVNCLHPPRCHMPQLRGSLEWTRLSRQDADTPLFHQLRPALPAVLRVKDGRRLLREGPFPLHPDVLSLDLVEGCVHGCGFCPVRAAETMRGGSEVRLLDHVAEVLQEELEQLPDPS